jgi:hypothetical protein
LRLRGRLLRSCARNGEVDVGHIERENARTGLHAVALLHLEGEHAPPDLGSQAHLGGFDVTRCAKAVRIGRLAAGHGRRQDCTRDHRGNTGTEVVSTGDVGHRG